MATAKKSPAKKSATKSAKKATGNANHCWPGFKPVAGKTPGTKGSCEPKAKQSKTEKKADSKAAAASKRDKGKG